MKLTANSLWGFGGSDVGREFGYARSSELLLIVRRALATFALIPGGGGDPWEWHRLVPALNARGHEAVAVRLPAEDDTAGWSEYADTVVEALDDREEVIVVAESMGGFTAQIVCARRQVELLVMLNAMVPVPRHTIEIHDDVVRGVLVGFGGREMNTAGDSFLVLFDSAERAISCGLALFEALAGIGISIRVGVYSGEVIVADEKVRGLAVHVAARIVAEADSGEVLISRITRDLAKGSRGLTFEGRGRHRLEGVEGEQELFAAS
jgi:class 3 adenylate cyclase